MHFASRLIALSILATLLAGGCSRNKAGADKEFKGGGSTLIAPLMTKWAEVYAQEDRGKLNYDPSGSGAGVFQTIEKTLDFGCTDAPLDEQDLLNAKSKGGEVLHIPVALSGVVIACNLEGQYDGVTLPALRFTGPLLADIYLGKIKKWNDPRLQAVQEEPVKLPDKDIVVVHRSDGSGTTYAFSDFLSRVSPEWKEKMGTSTAFKWPVGEGQNGNQGVADSIKRIPGALGYTQGAYALADGLWIAHVQNQAGEFVLPTSGTYMKAAQGALKHIPTDLRLSLANAPGEDSYPISTVTWAIVYVQPPRNAKQVAEFLRWAVNDGQKYAKDVQFAPLPQALIDKSNSQIDRIIAK
jgi:phosphate transport system substrate-binding protein